jgi:Malectin domain
MSVRIARLTVATMSVVILAGCTSESSKPAPQAKPAMKAPATVSAKPTAMAQPMEAAKAIRIDAGSPAAITDKAGNSWLADTGFTDGEILDRGDIAIAGTDTPELYRTERFGMTQFTLPVPNGKYQVKLHFAETFDGITAAGERIFSVNVQGTELKGIDPFKEAGGANKAIVKTVPVEVKDGKLQIMFTPDVQSPEINAIEIIPAQ